MRKTAHPLWRMLLWILALGWVGVLFFLSTQSAESSGSLSLRVTEFLLRVFPGIPLNAEALHPIIRKLAHFGVFAVEGFLFGLASMESFPGAFSDVLSVFFCAVMAALNEYSQMLAEGRSCEVRDMLIDFSGAVLGIVFAALVHSIFDAVRRHKKKKLTYQA